MAENSAAKRPRTSVCVASYNGAKYIAAQLESILKQLADGDEIVVVDDCSTDDTVAVVESLADDRIRLVRAERNQGYVKTFERAITLATGEVIFLSDQDDLWIDGRVDVMLAALAEAELVVTNFAYFGGEVPPLQTQRLRASDSTRAISNILTLWVGTRLYYGCCMAFRSSLKSAILPFPSYLTETHDQWIGYVANARRSVRHLEADSIARRIHDANATAKSSRSLGTILKARVMTGRAILEALRRRSRV